MSLDSSKLLKTDPRTEAIMWIGVSCPLVYAVSKQGFNLSTGSAALVSAAWGAGLWYSQTGMLAAAWNAMYQGVTSKSTAPAFVLSADAL